MPRQHDLIDLTEAAYQRAASSQQWASSVAAAARPLLDHGAGVLCQIFALDPPSTIALHVETDDGPLRQFLLEHDRKTERRPDLLVSERPGLLSLRETAGDQAALGGLARDFEAFGFRDLLHVTAVDGTDQCVMVAALVRHERRRAPRARCWPLVAAHLAAALRLQRRYGDLLEALAPDAAVLESSGKVAHAAGRAQAPEAIERLRHAARDIDRARTVTRRQDDALALEVWEGLVAGTWSLVDRHDHDGRRYIVAVPNDPEVPDPRGLSMREAQVAALAAAGQGDKLIAYTLGLERSTVATHLVRAMRKLGVSGRVELARVFRSRKPAAGERTGAG